MLPGVLADFLDRASVAAAATRDASLVPSVHWVSGWRLEPDRQTLVCMIPEVWAEGMIRRLEENGAFAVTVEQIGPHETYQFKGRYVGWRPVEPADLPVYEACRDRYAQAVFRMLSGRLPLDRLRDVSYPPSLAVRFRVEEIFVQTPGPAAGHRIYPREEA